MASRDLASDIKVVPALLSVALSATTNGLIIDTKGFESVTFEINVGTATAGFDSSNKFVVTASAGNAVNDETTPTSITDAATVTSADLIGTPPELDATGDDEKVYRFGYRGVKRYIRLVFTETGTAAAPISATCILSHARHLPIAEQTT